ncbi:rhsC element core protein RshC [Escherichia coli]|nr:rhsC element core protein RshC [Escherichia coli]
MLDRLESEILADRVSEESRRWLASCGLTVAQMQNQMDPVYTPARKIHLYHCDHRGLPLALISTEGATEWCAEYDEWGNLLNEENPHQLQQLIRLPGQQYDEESGLYYNRHRYYDPLQGRYITQDPIGLKGGWNFYQYPLNPITDIDPLGLATCLYSITLSMLSCVSDTQNDDNSYDVLTIPVASGNNVIICNVKIILVVHTYKIEVQYLKGYGAGMLMVLEQPIENLMVYV